jgi:photosystem II stability/assembly factor-like uncharacterized protein
MHKNTSLKLFLISLVAFLSIQFSNAQTWVNAGFVENPGLTPSVSVVNSNVAWICGGNGTNAKLYKTLNGGQNWIALSTNDIAHELGCIAALSPDIAFAGEGIVNGNANLYKTIDGGISWFTVFQTPPNRGFFNGLVFTKANGYIFALAIAERIYRSSNSGLNWIELNAGLNGVSNAHNSLFLVDNDFYGFGMNNGAARVRITPDNSYSWQTFAVGITGNYTSAIAFHTNKLYGVAATSSSLSTLARTTNGGTTWSPIDIGPGLTGTCYIQWIESTPVLYIVGSNGKVKRSINNGVNWTETPTANVDNITHFDFINVMNVIYGYAVSSDGDVIKLVDSVLVITGKNNNNSNIPVEYKLEQNYPNPFNPSTNIAFSIPNAEDVRLAVYDYLGQEVAVIKNEFMPAGNHEVNFNASDLSSGIYFYKLTAGNFVETKKMILVK